MEEGFTEIEILREEDQEGDGGEGERPVD